MKLYCQIVDDSGKLLTRRSLSIRRSSSMPWQASQSLDAESTKPSATAPGRAGLMAALFCADKQGRYADDLHCCWPWQCSVSIQVSLSFSGLVRPAVVQIVPA